MEEKRERERDGLRERTGFSRLKHTVFDTDGRACVMIGGTSRLYALALLFGTEKWHYSICR